MKPSWIRQLFARPVPHTIRKAPRRFLPGLEALEDRWVPSTFTVNSTGDLGTGSGLVGDLRYCIAQANSNPGADTIDFDSGVFATPQTIILSGGQLTLTDAATTTINGPAAGVAISGNNASRVFAINAGKSAAFSGLTITGGNISGNGGGVNNAGILA